MIHISKFMEAIEFAADKHKFQRRKGYFKIPYINHPLKVCKLLIESGESDDDIIMASILHDTIEDTDTTENDLTDKFGKMVTNLIIEVTDNMSLPEKVRKNLQVINASKLSAKAKMIRIADKIANINDILSYPINWTKKRKLKYIDWATEVFIRCKGHNALLDAKFEEICRKAMQAIGR